VIGDSRRTAASRSKSERFRGYLCSLARSLEPPCLHSPLGRVASHRVVSRRVASARVASSVTVRAITCVAPSVLIRAHLRNRARPAPVGAPRPLAHAAASTISRVQQRQSLSPRALTTTTTIRTTVSLGRATESVHFRVQLPLVRAAYVRARARTNERTHPRACARLHECSLRSAADRRPSVGHVVDGGCARTLCAKIGTDR